MDKTEILKVFFQDKGFDLKKIKGVDKNTALINKAFNKEDSLKVLDLYYNLEIPVLGGDVLYLNDKNFLDWTFDNWCVERLEQEDEIQYLKRSIKESRIYIEKYNNPSLKDRLILFDIVPKY